MRLSLAVRPAPAHSGWVARALPDPESRLGRACYTEVSMPGGFMTGLKRFILWDYPRAGWQYDLMVGLILAFIFLTPRDWFRDQARSSSVVMLPATHGASVFWIEPELLDPVPEAGRWAQAAELVKGRTGKPVTVVQLEPIFNSEQETKGYMAFTRP